jgi:hypothetical protein
MAAWLSALISHAGPAPVQQIQRTPHIAERGQRVGAFLQSHPHGGRARWIPRA